MSEQPSCNGERCPIGLNGNVSSELAQIRESMHRIEDALVGDPKMGNLGLVKRVERLEEVAEDHSRRLLIFATIATTAATGISFLLSKIGKLW